MSDFSMSIVPSITVYPNAEEKIREILDWLIAEDIIKPELTDCVLGSDAGYAVSEGAAKVVDGAEDLRLGLGINGLDVISSRTVFHSGFDTETIICPVCKANIIDKEWSLDAWYAGETDNFCCPSCNVESDIQQFEFSPEWGFSNIGFTFWNWPPFKDEFISKFKDKLGCDVRIMYELI